MPQPRLLLIDDEPALAEYLANAAKACGFEPIVTARDNEFREVIFEPQNLTNSCMVFDPFAPFFHGVRPIAFGKHRWMLGGEYVS